MDAARRAEINQAWAEGRKAGLEGRTEAANPYIGDPAKAKAWHEGWQEGNRP